MKTRDQVIAEVSRLAAAAAVPTLAPADVAACVDNNKRYTLWEVGLLLMPGMFVTPPLAGWNGRYYRVLSVGTTVEPAVWPTERESFINRRVLIPSLVAETSIDLIDAGPAFAEIYDIRGALGEAWMQKASAASQLHNFGAHGQRTEAKAIFDNCVRMAKAYGKVWVG